MELRRFLKVSREKGWPVMYGESGPSEKVLSLRNTVMPGKGRSSLGTLDTRCQEVREKRETDDRGSGEGGRRNERQNWENAGRKDGKKERKKWKSVQHRNGVSVAAAATAAA